MFNPAFLLPLATLHTPGGQSLGGRCNIGGILDQVGIMSQPKSNYHHRKLNLQMLDLKFESFNCYIISQV